MAQSLDSLFSKKVFIYRDDTLPYRLYVPVAANISKLPLIIFLHGAGERGRDNEHQLSNGVRYLLPQFKINTSEAIVIVPQCNIDHKWCEVPWDDNSHNRPSNISRYLGLTNELIDSLILSDKVDSKRVYLVGLSMGGYGVWDLAARYPNKFAAVVPICGGGDEKDADKLKTVPIWAFHGANDKVVLPARSSNMIKAIEQYGGKPLLTIYPSVGHDSWTKTLKTPELYTWLFGNSLK